MEHCMVRLHYMVGGTYGTYSTTYQCQQLTLPNFVPDILRAVHLWWYV